MATTQQIFAFRSRFAEFDTSDVDSAAIAEALDTASLWLDARLGTPDDFDMALLYWAAHYLTLKQMQLASVQFGGVGSSNTFLRSISFGERRVQFGERKALSSSEKMLGPAEQMLTDTMYGQLFLMLRARNIIPVAVV
jgi:hypothetical protein